MHRTMSNGEDTEGAAGNNVPRRCAACNYLRRGCTGDCVLAPHFPASDPQRYEWVQRLFGAGNVARMLQQLPDEERGRAADALAAEARWRAQDPVYGCAGVIDRLQEEIRAVKCELARTQAQIAMHAQANHHRQHLQQQEQEHQQRLFNQELEEFLADF